MSSTSSTHHAAVSGDDDSDIVAIWLRRDPKRWAAGVLAGLFAGLVMAAFAGILAVAGGYEFLFPIKVAAAPVFGGAATDFSNGAAVIVGLIILETVCAFLGFVYAHFTGTNQMSTLLGAGFVWGVFSWIFISCLFSNSFTAIAALALPKGVLLPIDLVFGVSLTSVAFFDRALRGGSR